MEGSEGLLGAAIAPGQRLQGPQVVQLPCPPPPEEDDHPVQGRVTQDWQCVSARSLKAGLGRVHSALRNRAPVRAGGALSNHLFPAFFFFPSWRN